MLFALKLSRDIIAHFIFTIGQNGSFNYVVCQSDSFKEVPGKMAPLKRSVASLSLTILNCTFVLTWDVAHRKYEATYVFLFNMTTWATLSNIEPHSCFSMSTWAAHQNPRHAFFLTLKLESRFALEHEHLICNSTYWATHSKYESYINCFEHGNLRHILRCHMNTWYHIKILNTREF
jgi:hypothetical protein